MKKNSAKKKVRSRTIHTIQHKLVFFFVGVLLLSVIITVYQLQQKHNYQSNAQATNCTVSPTDQAIDSEEQKELQLVNAYRQQQGLGTLQLSPPLNKAAAWLSKDMHDKNYLSHTDSLGRDTNARITQCATFLNGAAENIYDLNSSADAAFNWWRNSPVHNANMTLASFKFVGIARTGNFWTMDFSEEDPSASMPSQAPANTGAPTVPPPTVLVPSPGCLGGCPTLSVSAPPTIASTPPTISQPSVMLSVTPTDTLAPAPPAQAPIPPAGGGGLITLLLGFFALIIQLFLSLLGGGR